MTTDPSRRAYSIKEARHKIGVCNASLYNLLNSGVLPARKLGKRTVILADDLDQYLTSLPAYEPRKSAA